jgi:hypothetical protein
MATTPHDSTGTAFTFPGFTGSITGLTWTVSDAGGGGGDVIDISHLGQTTGATVLTQSRPLKGSATTGDTGKTVSIEFIGTGMLSQGATGTLTVSGPFSISGGATCNSCTLTLAVNDVVRGSAEFQYS